MINAALPKEVVFGQDLTDLFLVSETREDGVTAVEVVLSTVLIDQVVQYLSAAPPPAMEPPAVPAK